MDRCRVVGRALTIALFAGGVLAPGRVGAQRDRGDPPPLLTLDEAVAIALRDNLSVADAELGLDKATASVSAARTQRLPSLSLDAATNYSFLRQPFTVPGGAFGDYPIIGPIPATDTTLNSITGPYGSASVGITQPLLQLHRIGLVISQFELEESVAQQNLRARQQEVTKQVKQQYYEILKTQSALDAAEASVAFYRELVKLVDYYVQQDVAPEYESLETQARLARAEHKTRSERNALETQEERLNNLLGRDPRIRFRVSEQASASRSGYPSMADAESIALAQRPDVQEKLLKLKQAETGYRITKSEYIPSLNLFMRFSQLFNVDFVPSTDWSIGLQLRWDIYDWGKKGQDLARKNADVMQATNEVRDVRAQVAIEVDSRIRDLEEAQELVKVTQISQAAASEKLRVLTNQYKEQSALLKDVLQAESELADANNEYQQAVLSLWTAQAQLEKALGQS